MRGSPLYPVLLVLVTAGCSSTDDEIAAAGFPAPAPEGCVDTADPGHHTFECGEFVFDVEVPDACQSSACGLIVDVHGLSMNAAMQDASTQLRKLGRAEGYVVIQPNANPGPPAASWNSDGDHDGDVFAMVERALRVWHLDENRVHFTGFSQGGAMTWRMLCAHADVFASVAPSAHDGGCSFESAEVPSLEVPTLYMHGTTDQLVGYDGAVAQRDRLINAWQLGDGETVASDGQFEHTRYTSASGTHFEFLKHDYAQTESCSGIDLGGHCFPGSSDPGGIENQLCSFACPDTAAFDWGQEVMSFFLAHPRSPAE